MVEITLAEGRDAKVLRALIHRVHDAVQTSLNADAQSIRVIVREVPRSLWAAGDQTLEERDAEQPGSAAPSTPARSDTEGT